MGVATAAHQIEGNNANSDYWVMEHVSDSYFKEKSGDGCDSWNRWPEDIALIKSAGLNAYRFSVEWARIEPEQGEFSQATLDYYRRLRIACRNADIEPVVTLHHFTSPRWVAAIGGWEIPAVIDRYARYVERTARALGDVVGWFCTMNEPNTGHIESVATQTLGAGTPPARRGSATGKFRQVPYVFSWR